MNIPENKNKVPDILDEARWELEFELKMQVPEGKTLAGMVHHKIHDAKWTPLSLRAARGSDAALPPAAQHGGDAEPGRQRRRRRRASGRRSTRRSPTKCLKAAERAWAAAEANPEIYAPTGGDGGGPYDDNNVERRLLLGGGGALHHDRRRPSTRTFVDEVAVLQEAPTHDWGDDPGMYTSMTWGDTRRAGIDLAGDRAERPAARTSSRRSARTSSPPPTRTWTLRRQAGLPRCRSPRQEGLPVGLELVRAEQRAHARRSPTTSRSDGKYLNGVALGMDYILGRNPLDQSYVTGWGERPLENPLPPLLVPPGEPEVPAAAARRPVGRPELRARGSLRGGRRPEGLRAAEVLRRQRRGLVGQRGDDQLERAAGLGGRVPRREGAQGEVEWFSLPSSRPRGGEGWGRAGREVWAAAGRGVALVAAGVRSRGRRDALDGEAVDVEGDRPRLRRRRRCRVNAEQDHLLAVVAGDPVIGMSSVDRVLLPAAALDDVGEVPTKTNCRTSCRRTARSAPRTSIRCPP